METFIFILECIGTIAFAVSGALEAIRKKMDLLGVMVLGMITAVGGGMIRDILIGVTPPHVFRNPVYTILAVITSLLVFGIIYRQGDKHFQAKGKYYGVILLVSDTAGLGLFTVLGVQVAVEQGWERQIFLLIFVGVITGVGGGLLRDIFSGSIPYIFRKHVYATASIGGAVVCSLLLYHGISQDTAMIIGAGVVMILRFMAARFKWNLPRIESGERY